MDVEATEASQSESKLNRPSALEREEAHGRGAGTRARPWKLCWKCTPGACMGPGSGPGRGPGMGGGVEGGCLMDFFKSANRHDFSHVSPCKKM